MSHNSTITHKGRIVDVNPAVTTVEIISESACAACHAKSLCCVSESSSKLIEVPTSGWDSYAPGDVVTVEMRASLGHKAVFLGYGVPLVLLIAGIVAPSYCGVGELWSGLCAISLVSVYYLCLWLVRDRLHKEYIFNIKKQ